MGLRRISCASQFTRSDTAGASPDPACNNTDMRSSQLNQASRATDFSYPLVSSTSFSSSSPISLFLMHISTIISNHPNFRLKHPGVPDASDSSDRTWYALTENDTLPVAQAKGRVAHVPPVLCGDVYASSERHVCYTLRRGCSYAEAVYTPPGDRRPAWEHMGAPATCQGAPRITVMYSVCILIYVSMYLYSYPSTHTISGLAAVCRKYTPRHPVHLRYPFDRACLRSTWRRRLSELRDALGGRD